MIKTFRSNTTIQAEQFDGSKEMIKKYGIGEVNRAELEGAESEYGDDIHYFLNPKLIFLKQEIKIGDWLVRDLPRLRVMSNQAFKETYSEVPNAEED